MESIGPRELAADLRGGILSPGFKKWRPGFVRTDHPGAKSQNAAAAISESPSAFSRSQKSCGQLLRRSRPRSGRCSPIGFMAQNEAGELSVLYFARHNFKLKIIGAGWG